MWVVDDATIRAETQVGPIKQSRRCLAQGAGYELVLAEYAANTAMPAHRHDYSKLSLVLAGSLKEETEDEIILAGPGCVGFKPAGAEHGDRFGEDGALIFSLRFDPRWKPASATIKDYSWQSQDAMARRLLTFYAAANSTDEAALIRWLLSWDDPVTPSKMRTAPPWLQSVQDRLHRGESASSDIGSLAKEHDIHPVYLARAFRQRFGTSPSEYARRARITRAAGELAAGETPVAEIAARFGFADHAHFCRCFQAQLGMTPGAYRRLARFL